LPPNQTRLSLGLYFFEVSSALVFAFESSTFFHKLAILLVTFFFGCVGALVLGLLARPRDLEADDPGLGG